MFTITFMLINLNFLIFISTMNSEKFCLKWNDFQPTVSRSLANFRKEEDLFDITLVSDDEIQLQAHKGLSRRTLTQIPSSTFVGWILRILDSSLITFTRVRYKSTKNN